MDQTDHIDSEEAPIKIPNFELTKELGRGGMSESTARSTAAISRPAKG